MPLFSKSPLEQMIEGSYTTRQRNQFINSVLDKVIAIIKEEPPEKVIEKIEQLKYPLPKIFAPSNSSSLK